ncbi:MAG TPA: hypothetical protein DCG12_04005 [Planctomycetaceae bacterium]|nr:hypothetical protein [Planctomycetaceae bacterium]
MGWVREIIRNKACRVPASHSRIAASTSVPSVSAIQTRARDFVFGNRTCPDIGMEGTSLTLRQHVGSHREQSGLEIDH